MRERETERVREKLREREQTESALRSKNPPHIRVSRSVWARECNRRRSTNTSTSEKNYSYHTFVCLCCRWCCCCRWKTQSTGDLWLVQSAIGQSVVRLKTVPKQIMFRNKRPAKKRCHSDCCDCPPEKSRKLSKVLSCDKCDFVCQKPFQMKSHQYYKHMTLKVKSASLVLDATLARNLTLSGSPDLPGKWQYRYFSCITKHLPPHEHKIKFTPFTIYTNVMNFLRWEDTNLLQQRERFRG